MLNKQKNILSIHLSLSTLLALLRIQHFKVMKQKVIYGK